MRTSCRVELAPCEYSLHGVNPRDLGYSGQLCWDLIILLERVLSFPKSTNLSGFPTSTYLYFTIDLICDSPPALVPYICHFWTLVPWRTLPPPLPSIPRISSKMFTVHRFHGIPFKMVYVPASHCQFQISAATIVLSPLKLFFPNRYLTCHWFDSRWLQPYQGQSLVI